MGKKRHNLMSRNNKWCKEIKQSGKEMLPEMLSSMGRPDGTSGGETFELPPQLPQTGPVQQEMPCLMTPNALGGSWNLTRERTVVSTMLGRFVSCVLSSVAVNLLSVAYLHYQQSHTKSALLGVLPTSHFQ